MSTPVHCGEDGEHPAHRPPFRGLGVNTLLEDTHSHSKFAHIGFVGLYSRLAEATVSVMKPTLVASVLATSIDRTVVENTPRVEEPIPPRSAGFPFTQPPVPRRRKLAHGTRGCRCIWLDPRQAGIHAPHHHSLSGRSSSLQTCRAVNDCGRPHQGGEALRRHQHTSGAPIGWFEECARRDRGPAPEPGYCAGG